MRRLRAALRWLDPWAASLLGVLVALGVVILLATPGPWHVGEAPRVQRTPSRPADIAVFVLGGPGTRCTGVLWLHADYEHPSLTACVLVAPTQGRVDGGGYAAVDRLVSDAGPKQAAAALGAVLGVTMDAWAIVDKRALNVAVPAMFPTGEQLAERREYARARAGWAGAGGAARAWPRQYQTLAAALPETRFGDLNIVGFSNYVLGFGYVKSDLDLQGAASLAQLLQGLQRSQVRVRAVPAVLHSCRRGRAWRVDEAALEQLRGSLAFGVAPPPSRPTVALRRVSAAVVVADPPGGAAGRAYLRELRGRLRASAGAPVRLETLRVPAGSSLAAAIGRRLDEGRPLAVVVAAGLAPLDRSAGDVRHRDPASGRGARGSSTARRCLRRGAAGDRRRGRDRLRPEGHRAARGAVCDGCRRGGRDAGWDVGTARTAARANAATSCAPAGPGLWPLDSPPRGWASRARPPPAPRSP